MDIKELVSVNTPANEGVWVHIKDPNSFVELPIKFKVLGVSSDKFFELRDKINSETFSAVVDGKPVDSEEQGLRLVAAMVVDIDGLEMDGRVCTAADALAIFKTPGLRFIYNQLDVEIKNRLNFIKP